MHEITLAGLSSDSLIRVGADRQEIWTWLGDRSRLWVSDETVYGLYKDFFKDEEPFLIPPGEASKSPSVLIRLLETMAQAGLDRTSCLVAVGGGVVSDLAVLAAGLYMRGIAVAVVSTSLLGQIDASVGGKCAINLIGVKNLVGLFKQPELVVCDTTMLITLPQSEWRNGLGELVKHAFLQGPKALIELAHQTRQIVLREPLTMADIIFKSLQYKAGIVQLDERETGRRRILNLGHTFGHIFEAQGGLGHGEAVALGLIMALRYSVRLGLMKQSSVQDGLELMSGLGLPMSPPALSKETVRFGLGLDKKKQQHEINLVLLEGYGQPIIYKQTLEEVVNVWTDLCLHQCV